MHLSKWNEKSLSDMDAQAQMATAPCPGPFSTKKHVSHGCLGSHLKQLPTVLFCPPDVQGSFISFYTCINVQKMGAPLLYSKSCDLLVVIFSRCQTVKCIFNISVLKKCTDDYLCKQHVCLE